MSEAPGNPTDGIDYAKLAKAGTSELVDEIGKLREANRATTERINQEYEFPESYDSSMGLKVGRVTELRIFFHVKPGRAEALKEELRSSRKTKSGTANWRM